MKLNLADISIRGADSLISLNLELDTDKPEPANGDFILQSTLLDAEAASISGALRWSGEQLMITSPSDAGSIDMNIALPLKLIKKPQLAVSTEGKIDGRLRYDGDISPFAAYLPASLQTLEGALQTDIKFGGDTKQPDITGTAALANGAYTELQSGFSLINVHANAEAAWNGAGSTVSIRSGARGAGQTGADTINLAGDIRIGDESDLTLFVTLKDAVLSAFPVKQVRANGSIEIKGALDDLTATGNIMVEELDAEIITPENTGLAPITVISLDEANQSEAEGLSAKPQSNIAYEISVSADDRVFIRGRGLESEWGANVTAMNDQGEPLLLGAMRLRRGWLDFSGRRFDLTKGRIEFDRFDKNNPILDIRAELNTSDNVTAVIAISGRAKTPSITLTSTPALPSEDIMAIVLFGKSADQLTALESLQTAQALASLGGIGPFGGEGVTGGLRQATGLDLLNFDIDPEKGGGSLTVGKYVTDGLFVSGTQDAQGDNGSVRIEYELTDNITVETEIKQDGDQTVSANWKRDF